MPYKFYYGKTGRVWNVTKRAVGVEMLKTVGNRKRTKRFHVRIEHIRPSTCRDKFLNRVKSNEKQKAAVRELKGAEKEAASSPLKRTPQGPKPGYLLKKRACRKMLPMW